MNVYYLHQQLLTTEEKKKLSSLETYLTSCADIEQLNYRRTTTTDTVKRSKKHQHIRLTTAYSREYVLTSQCL